DLPRFDLAAHRRPGQAPPHDVAIDAQDALASELAYERGFDALRALSQGSEVLVAALGAARRHRGLVTAVMAAQVSIRKVQDELGRATVTPREPAAAAARQHRGVAAPVDEDQALFAPRARFGYRAYEMPRDPFGWPFRPCIEAMDGRRRSADAPGQRQQPITVRDRIVVG